MDTAAGDHTADAPASRELSELAAIQELSSEAIVGLRPDGIITRWNRAAEQLYGYSAKEVQGKPLSVLLPTEQSDEQTALLAQLRVAERLDQYPATHRRKNGQHIQVSLSLAQIKSPADRVASILCVVHDVEGGARAGQSQRELLLQRWRLARSEATAAQQEIAALYEATRQIIGSLDLTVTINNILDAVARLTEDSTAGLALIDPTGTTLRYDWVRGKLRHILEGLPFRVPEGGTGAAFATGELINIPDIERDSRWQRRTDVDFTAIRSALYVPLQIHDRRTGVLCAVSEEPGHFTLTHERLMRGFAEQAALAIDHAREVAERKQAEERFRFMAEATGDVLYRLRFDTLRYDYMSPAIKQLTGYTPSEINELGFGHIVEKVLAPSGEEITGQPTQEQSLAGDVRSYHADYLIRTKSGEPRWLSDHSESWRDASDQLLGSVGLLSDITDRKRLEEELRQAQKMEAVGKLAGGVAHDFNNLLTVINGYADLLRNQLSPRTPQREAAEQILRAGESAASLTRQLLAFSRKQMVSPKPINLNQVVRHTARLLDRLIGEDVMVTTVLVPDLGMIQADASQMEQVVLNLVTNARDAMPRGGKITIETRNVDIDDAYVRHHPDALAGPHALLMVSDTGIGMDAATQARIFDPFFTTKEVGAVGKGTGLGLAAVYGIVRQSAGSIEVASAVGHGTTFKVYFPRVAETPAVRPVIGGEGELPGGSETILIVEDDQHVRLLAREILGGNGYLVLEADSSESAFQLAKQHAGPIHLLLTDVVMPGLGGGEVAKHLSTWYPGLKVLFISGYTDDVVVRHGVIEANVSFLPKPFTPVGLSRKVRQVLDAG